MARDPTDYSLRASCGRRSSVYGRIALANAPYACCAVRATRITIITCTSMARRHGRLEESGAAVERPQMGTDWRWPLSNED